MHVSMLRRSLTGCAALAAVAGGLLVAVPAHAGYTSDCSTLGGTTEGPVTVYTTSRVGAAVGAGVCVQGGTGSTLPAGGDLEVGVNPSGGTVVPGPGFYAILDGSDSNPPVGPATQGQGYIGVSNYDPGGFNPGPGCFGCATSGDNGGGQVGVKGVATLPVNLPIACGDTTGPDWDTTSRDGCFVP